MWRRLYYRHNTGMWLDQDGDLLTGATASGFTQAYGYDPLLRFATETTSGTVLPRSYAYDGDNMLVINRNGLFLARVVHGPGESEPLYQIDNQGNRY